MEKSLKITEENELSPQSLISQAIAQNVNVEMMEKLMDLQDRWDEKQAKKKFDVAMAKFQSECPVIKKEKDGGKTKSGMVAYKYAPLDAIVTQVKKSLQANGFSYALDTKTTEKSINITCWAKHEGGHSEPSTIEIPTGSGTEIMSAPQKAMAAMTFGKRYAFCNAFGIITGDDDNEKNLTGIGMGKVPVSTKNYEVQMKASKTLEDLRTTFMSFPIDIQTLEPIKTLKDELKAKLTV